MEFLGRVLYEKPVVNHGPLWLVRALAVSRLFYLDLLRRIDLGIALAQPAIASLKNVPVPEPPNLADFVKDKQAAIALGKAMFWDMQFGSDGVQGCASCHSKAGADNRTKNQISPGLNALTPPGGDTVFGNTASVLVGLCPHYSRPNAFSKL